MIHEEQGLAVRCRQVQTLPPVPELHLSCPAWGQGAFWKTPGEAVVSCCQLWRDWVLKIQVCPGTGQRVGSICSVLMQLNLRGKEEKTRQGP